MDKGKLENIIKESIESVFIEYLTEKVLLKLDNYNKKALVIFTGTCIGFDESIKCLKKLKIDGWNFDVVLSNDACNIFTESLIKELLGSENIIKENKTIDIQNLVNENTLVIISTLSVNSCSKIVNCISDSIATNIVSYSLISGKKIIASVNGCCPDNEQRLSLFGDNTTKAYKNTLRNNIEKLSDYGIITTKSENIDFKIKKIFENKYSLARNITKEKQNTTKQQCKNIDKKLKSDIFSDEIILDKKIISRNDIYNLRKYKTIKVNKDCIITDLAKEEAIKNKINLLKI